MLAPDAVARHLDLQRAASQIEHGARIVPIGGVGERFEGQLCTPIKPDEVPIGEQELDPRAHGDPDLISHQKRLVGLRADALTVGLQERRRTIDDSHEAVAAVLDPGLWLRVLRRKLRFLRRRRGNAEQKDDHGRGTREEQAGAEPRPRVQTWDRTGGRLVRMQHRTTPHALTGSCRSGDSSR